MRGRRWKGRGDQCGDVKEALGGRGGEREADAKSAF
jgi:hypothetical protein